MVTSFYKLLLWPTFQDTPLIKQTIGGKLRSRFFEERVVSCTQHWGSVFSNHVWVNICCLPASAVGAEVISLSSVKGLLNFDLLPNPCWLTTLFFHMTVMWVPFLVMDFPSGRWLQSLPHVFLVANSSAVDMLKINYLEHISGIKYKSQVLELEMFPSCKLIWQLLCLIFNRAKICLGFVLVCV